MNRRCIALLGGSFDPVHSGHVALGNYFSKLLFPDELRIIPAGTPWQKHSLKASPEQRIDMLQSAFADHAISVLIDQQEIHRHGPTYTIDTLLTIRQELGNEASIVLLIGADQLQQLNTWKEWLRLFDHTHVCAASRPGFDMADLPSDVAREFNRRTATPAQIRATPHGLTYLATNLAVDVSSTEIRTLLQNGEPPGSLVPQAVLDYIKQHHLYQN